MSYSSTNRKDSRVKRANRRFFFSQFMRLVERQRLFAPVFFLFYFSFGAAAQTSEDFVKNNGYFDASTQSSYHVGFDYRNNKLYDHTVGNLICEGNRGKRIITITLSNFTNGLTLDASIDLERGGNILYSDHVAASATPPASYTELFQRMNSHGIVYQAIINRVEPIITPVYINSTNDINSNPNFIDDFNNSVGQDKLKIEIAIESFAQFEHGDVLSLNVSNRYVLKKNIRIPIWKIFDETSTNIPLPIYGGVASRSDDIKTVNAYRQALYLFPSHFSRLAAISDICRSKDFVIGIGLNAKHFMSFGANIYVLDSVLKNGNGVLDTVIRKGATGFNAYRNFGGASSFPIETVQLADSPFHRVAMEVSLDTIGCSALVNPQTNGGISSLFVMPPKVLPPRQGAPSYLADTVYNYGYTEANLRLLSSDICLPNQLGFEGTSPVSDFTLFSIVDRFGNLRSKIYLNVSESPLTYAYDIRPGDTLRRNFSEVPYVPGQGAPAGCMMPVGGFKDGRDSFINKITALHFTDPYFQTNSPNDTILRIFDAVEKPTIFNAATSICAPSNNLLSDTFFIKNKDTAALSAFNISWYVNGIQRMTVADSFFPFTNGKDGDVVHAQLYKKTYDTSCPILTDTASLVLSTRLSAMQIAPGYNPGKGYYVALFSLGNLPQIAIKPDISDVFSAAGNQYRFNISPTIPTSIDTFLYYAKWRVNGKDSTIYYDGSSSTLKGYEFLSLTTDVHDSIYLISYPKGLGASSACAVKSDTIMVFPDTAAIFNTQSPSDSLVRLNGNFFPIFSEDITVCGVDTVQVRSKNAFPGLTIYWYKNRGMQIGSVLSTTNTFSIPISEGDSIIYASIGGAINSPNEKLRSDTIRIRPYSDPYFSLRPADSVHIAMLRGIFEPHSSVTEICPPSAATLSFSIQRPSSAFVLSSLDYKWYKNGNDFRAGVPVAGAFDTTYTATKNDAQKDTTIARIMRKNSTCAILHYIYYPHFDTTFSTYKPGDNREYDSVLTIHVIRVWNTDSLKGSLIPSHNELFCSPESLNISLSAYNQGDVDTALIVQWYNGSNIITGQSDKSLTAYSAREGDSIYKISSPKALPLCRVSSDTIRVLSYSDPVFRTNNPGNGLLRYNRIRIKSSDSIICPGGTINLSFYQAPAGASYQWFKNGRSIGILNSVSAVANVGDSFRLVVSPPGCSTSSDTIYVLSSLNPLFATRRADSNLVKAMQDTMRIIASANDLCYGSFSVTLSAKSSDSLKYTYKWYKNNTLVAGAANASASFSFSSGDSARVEISDAVCSSYPVSSIYALSNTNAYFDNTHSAGYDASAKRYYLRLWDSIKGKISPSVVDICLDSAVEIRLNNYNTGKVSDLVNGKWYKNRAAVSGNVNDPTMLKLTKISANDTFYYASNLASSLLPNCAVYSDTFYTLSNSNSYFVTQSPNANVARINDARPAVFTADTNLCVGPNLDISLRYPFATASFYDHEWRRAKSAAIINATDRISNYSAIAGDSIWAIISLTPPYAVGSTCLLRSDTLVVKSNSDNVFSSSPMSYRLIKIWDSIGASLGALEKELCLSNLSNTYSVASYKKGSQSSDYDFQWYQNGIALGGAGARGASITIPNNQRNDSIWLALTTRSDKGSCAVYSDTIFIRSNSDPIFNTKDTSDKLIRVFDSMLLSIQFNSNATGGYDFCNDDFINIQVANSYGSLISYDWYRVNGAAPQKIGTTKNASDRLMYRSYEIGDTIYAVAVNAAACSVNSDTLYIKDPSYAGATSAKCIRYSLASYFNASLEANEEDFCLGANIIFRVNTLNRAGATDYTWRYKRKNAIFTFPTATVISDTANSKNDLAAGDTIWATLKDKLGCEYLTDSVILYSAFASGNPAKSKKRIYVYDSLHLSTVADKKEICLGIPLTAEAKWKLSATPSVAINAYKWRIKNISNISAPGDSISTSSHTVSIPNTNMPNDVRNGDVIWAEVSTNISNGRICAANTDTIRISSTILPAIADTQNVSFYSIISASNEASVSSFCAGDSLLFSLSNLQGNPNVFKWKRIDKAGVLSDASMDSTVSFIKIKNLVNGDKLFVELKNSAGCLGYSDTVEISNALSVASATKKKVKIYDTISAVINADAAEYCNSDNAILRLTNLKGNPTTFFRILKGSTNEILTPTFATPQGYAIAVSSLDDLDYVVAKVQNNSGCIGYSDTLRFHTDPNIAKSTTTPLIKKARIGSLSSPLNYNTYCSGNMASILLSAPAGYTIDTSTIRWYTSDNNVVSQIVSAAGRAQANLTLGSDVSVGSIVYAQFSEQATAPKAACTFISDSITFVGGTQAVSSKRWRIVLNPQRNILAAQNRYCVTSAIRISDTSTVGGNPSYTWYRRIAQTGVTNSVVINNSKSYNAGTLSRGDAVWATISTTIPGCVITTDTVIVMGQNSSRTPSRKYPLVYDSIGALLQINDTAIDFCSGAQIPIRLVNMTGDITNATWRRKPLVGAIGLMLPNSSSSRPLTPSDTVRRRTTINTVKVGDSLWVEIRNATGCVGYSDTIRVFSNKQNISPTGTSLVMYEQLGAIDTADKIEICKDDKVTISVFLPDSVNVNGLIGSRISQTQFRVTKSNGFTGNPITIAQTSYQIDTVEDGDVYRATVFNNRGCSETLNDVVFSSTLPNPPDNRNVLIHKSTAGLTVDKNRFCAGDAVTFSLNNLTTVPASGVLIQKWNLLRGNRIVATSVGATYTIDSLRNGDSVWCELTDPLGCVFFSDTISVSNRGTPTAERIVVSDLTNLKLTTSTTALCPNTAANYRVNIPTGVTGVSLRWFYFDQSTNKKDNFRTTTATQNNTILDANTYVWVEYGQTGCAARYQTDTVYLISNSSASNSFTKEIVVYDSATVNVNVLNNNLVNIDTFCLGEQVTFNLSFVTRLKNPTYNRFQWFKNRVRIAGAISSGYTASDFKDSDTLYCEMYIQTPSALSSCKVTSKAKVVKNARNGSNPLNKDREIRILDNVRAHVTTSVDSFCSFSPVTFNLQKEIDSDSIYGIQWVYNGVIQNASVVSKLGTTATYSSLRNGDRIWARLYSKGSCVYYSDTVYVVNVRTAPSRKEIRIFDLEGASINASITAVCIDSAVMLNFPDFERANRNVSYYQWYVNTTLVTTITNNASGAASFSSLKDGDIVYARIQESNCFIISSDTFYVRSSGKPALARPKVITIFDDIYGRVAFDDADRNVCSDQNVIFTLPKPPLTSFITDYQWFRIMKDNLTGADIKVRGPLVNPSSSTGYFPINDLKEGDRIFAELRRSSGAGYCPGNSDTIYVVANRETSKIDSPFVISVFDKPDYTINIISAFRPNSREFCEGENVEFSINRKSGVSTNTFQWYKETRAISGETARTYLDNQLVVGDVISAVATNPGCTVNIKGITVTSTDVALSADSLIRFRPISNSLIPSTSLLCGTDSISFTIPNPPGIGTFSYRWYLNNTIIPNENGSIYTNAGFQSRDEVYAVIANDVGCEKNTDTITFVTGVLVPRVNEVRLAQLADIQADIAPSQPVYCLATPLATVNIKNIADTATRYVRWYRNGVLESSAYSYQHNVAVGDEIYASIRLKTGCFTDSDTVTIVDTEPTVENEAQLLDFNAAADISTFVDEFCESSRVPFVVNNGVPNALYSYKWKINNKVQDSVPVFITSNLSIGDIIWAEVSNNIGCVSNSDSMIVVGGPPANSQELYLKSNCKVTTGTIPPQVIGGDIIKIGYTSDLTSILESADKNYEVQLSQPDGSFNTYTVLSSVVRKDLGGTIDVQIPYDAAAGCRYRIRVVIKGLDINYIANQGDIFIVGDLKNYNIRYSPDQSLLSEGKAGKSGPIIVDRRGCDVKFKLIANFPGITIDSNSGEIRWSETTFNKNYELITQMSWPFDPIVGIKFEAPYFLRAIFDEFNIQLYPNPVKAADGIIRLGFQVNTSSHIKITILDEAGRVVKIPLEKNVGPDTYVEFIDISGLPSGIYSLILEVNGERVARQFMVI